MSKILQWIEPAAPPVLGIAKESPRTQDPECKDADDECGQRAESVVIRRSQDETQSQQTLDSIDQGRNETQTDDAQPVQPGESARNLVVMGTS